MSALLPGNLPRIRFTHGNLFCPNARRRVLLDWSDSLLFGAWREVVIALSTCADLCELKTFWSKSKELSGVPRSDNPWLMCENHESLPTGCQMKT